MEWDDLFKEIKNKEYAHKLNSFLDEEYKTKVIIQKEKIFLKHLN